MKRIIILIVLLLGIFPHINSNRITIAAFSADAASFGSEYYDDYNDFFDSHPDEGGHSDGSFFDGWTVDDWQSYGELMDLLVDHSNDYTPPDWSSEPIDYDYNNTIDDADWEEWFYSNSTTINNSIYATKVSNLESQLLIDPFLVLCKNSVHFNKWQNLGLYKPNATAMTSLTNFANAVKNDPNHPFASVSLQNIGDAKGTVVNMDFFSVNVTTLPPNTTADQLLNQIRLNLSGYVNGSGTSFAPYTDPYLNIPDQRALWNSNDPTGAIVYIDIPGDDGAVLTSLYQSDKWVFSTIRAPHAGFHPVSGNREFGYTTNTDGSYTFYTRGVDRMTTTFDNIVQQATSIPFNETEKLWTIMINNITGDINNRGGAAAANSPVIQQPNWTKIKEYLTNPNKTFAQFVNEICQ